MMEAPHKLTNQTLISKLKMNLYGQNDASRFNIPWTVRKILRLNHKIVVVSLHVTMNATKRVISLVLKPWKTNSLKHLIDIKSTDKICPVVSIRTPVCPA